MIHRIVNISKSSSFFLFGARGVGKSTFLKDSFFSNLRDDQLYKIDLLDLDTESEIARRPQSIKEQIERRGDNLSWVLIDEVQKIPQILDVVHSIIENSKIKFALTGSSARKLKRGAANLLAGRAFVYHLFPFTHLELLNDFYLEDVLNWGSLPKVFQFTEDVDKRQFLKSYTQTYLKEEIFAEQIVRKLQPFRDFLEVAAQSSGKLINYSKIAKDINVDTKTTQSYFQILEDTLLGYLLRPFHTSIRKRQKTNPKFYFFDYGVKRALEGSLSNKILPRTYEYGNAFELFLINEMQRLNSYFQKDYKFSFFRTKDEAEIDLVIERPGMPLALVEIKSSNSISESEVSIINRLASEFGNPDCFCLSLDRTEKKIGRTFVLPWQKGIKELGLTLL